MDLAGIQEEKLEKKHQVELVKKAEAQVRPVLDSTLKKLGQNDPALKDELDGLEPLNARLETPMDVRRDALKKIEKLSDKLKSRRDSDEIAKVDEFKKMLRRLGNQSAVKSPVGELSKSLAKGDFKSAQAALNALQKQLSQTPKTDEEKKRAEELKKQLDQLSKNLNQIAQDQRKLEQKLQAAGLTDKDLQKALENLKKDDLEAVAKQMADKGLSQEQIQQAMKEVKKRCNACKAAGKLASSLGGMGGMAAQSESGQGASGAQGSQMAGLSAASEQLSEMESLEQELNSLNNSLSDLDGAKSQLGQSCSQCNGTGQCNGGPCPACGGTGMCQGTGMSRTGMGRKPGQGQGGIAPEEATAVQYGQRADAGQYPGGKHHFPEVYRRRAVQRRGLRRIRRGGHLRRSRRHGRHCPGTDSTDVPRGGQRLFHPFASGPARRQGSPRGRQGAREPLRPALHTESAEES